MGERGRADGDKRTPGQPAAEANASGGEPSDRPGASGHRFGPRLVCSECGVRWDVHQRNPQPCAVEAPSDPFARRPEPPR
jgi:hypothetical protein